ncbi:zona pellucida sperm-binding protein 3d.2 isoform X1 [Entelurus aequoreus]|uniref:zona pellucida sperm-binding protein 3d.2 isoform X1 n=1 Tax=Entelurus aequoreus TaxID=161455 RepID=UPI002B1D57B7|nr:zona pellucida sperm-binding protein 3d.2 isoform X1 [Entelurus aequoreus]
MTSSDCASRFESRVKQIYKIFLLQLSVFGMFVVPLLGFLTLFAASQADEARQLSPRRASPQTKDAILTQGPRKARPPYLKLPVYVTSELPPREKLHLSPATGTGLEPLPGPVQGRLLPARPGRNPRGPAEDSVRTLCKLDKMLVKVPKGILGGGEVKSEIKLGTCGAKKSSKNYVYFVSELSQCGTKRQILNGHVTYWNTLQYEPEMLQGLVRRTAPFTLPVACNYTRYQYSYKIGYLPKIRIRQIVKVMRNSANFILTPRNAQWERLSPWDQYVLGEPMYFEAEGPPMPDDMRLYLRSCYVTPDKSHTSAPQFAVVTNFGCMAESKYGRSRFIAYKNNAVRFSVDAFLFRGMTNQQLHMHCSMSAESASPTPTAKSCNYDTHAARWVELYGSDWVCACCNSNCGPAAPAVRSMTSSSGGWMVQPEGQFFKNKKTTSFPHTKAAPPVKVMASATTTEAKPEHRTDLKWPFGGRGVEWVELNGEVKKVKDTAVVEQDFLETQHIFEEPEVKFSKNSERKKPTTTTTVLTSPQRPRTAAEGPTTPWPEVKGRLNHTVTETEWPIGGGGVEWVEEEEEVVKGSAVVLEEVKQPRRTFEDLFEFDQ